MKLDKIYELWWQSDMRLKSCTQNVIHQKAMIDSVYQARAIRAEILKRVNYALDVSEKWYGFYLYARNSKFPRARRYALRCRAKAVVIHDRAWSGDPLYRGDF